MAHLARTQLRPCRIPSLRPANDLTERCKWQGERMDGYGYEGCRGMARTNMAVQGGTEQNPADHMGRLAKALVAPGAQIRSMPIMPNIFAGSPIMPVILLGSMPIFFMVSKYMPAPGSNRTREGDK